jgi:transposase InsO family protein
VIYLSGKQVAHPRIGLMLSYNGAGYRKKKRSRWAADNGCFTQPQKYTDQGYLKWLDKLDRSGCFFATAPDVVGDADETLKRSKPMLPKIRELGYRVAFVAQDGAKIDSLPWADLDCLFVGGTDTFKLSQAAAECMREAKQRGKSVHMGRVNSYRRIRLAKFLGADSVDGTQLAYRPTRYLSDVLHWLDRLDDELMLEM